MAATAEKDDPALWDKIKAEVLAGDKGGEAGEWSARKAQYAVAEYKKRGGGYRGKRDPHNHLHEWTEEDWGTKSGHKSGETHERYLPKAAREALSDDEYRRTTAKKRADAKAGHQHSAQPKDVAQKTAPYRHEHGRQSTKAELMAEARRRNVPGRSKMDKAALAKAVAH
jgi:hypothetical protein